MSNRKKIKQDGICKPPVGYWSSDSGAETRMMGTILAWKYLERSMWLQPAPTIVSYTAVSPELGMPPKPGQSKFEVKEKSLIFQLGKDCQNASSSKSAESPSCTQTEWNHEEWVPRYSSTPEARPPCNRHGVRSRFKKGCAFHLWGVCLAVVTKDSLQLLASWATSL